jgi:hypothetical protein
MPISGIALLTYFYQLITFFRILQIHENKQKIFNNMWVDADSVLRLSQPVSVGDDADVSEVFVASIFKVEVCRLKTEAACTSQNISIITYNLKVQ